MGNGGGGAGCCCCIVILIVIGASIGGTRNNNSGSSSGGSYYYSPPPPPLCTAVNGAWSTWVIGSWSATCGSVTRQLTRRCDSPYPYCGGSYCSGSSASTETRETCCPVNGGWSVWSPSDYSATCGTMTQLKTRTCNNPAPTCGGSACSGAVTMTETTTLCCPVNGGWSSWSYQPWSATCGEVTRVKTRNCTNPAPSCGGSSCGSSSTDVEATVKCCSQPNGNGSTFSTPCPSVQGDDSKAYVVPVIACATVVLSICLIGCVISCVVHRLHADKNGAKEQKKAPTVVENTTVILAQQVNIVNVYTATDMSELDTKAPITSSAQCSKVALPSSASTSFAKTPLPAITRC